LQDKLYEKKANSCKFIRKHGKVDHAFILNEVNIDYDILMMKLSELHQVGLLKEE
jgi:hypothetical protein